MTTAARRRLMRDFKKLSRDPPNTGVAAAPHENNLMKWQAIIYGPEDTDWEGGTFKL